MKSIYQLTLLLSTLIILCSNSCIKSGGKCEMPIDIRSASSIQVTFKDATTGKYLYEEAFPLYNKDSLKIFDENGNSLRLVSQKNRDALTNIGYWEIAFYLYNPQTDQSAFNAELCRNFIVKYKYNETDTIRACFKARTTECGSIFSSVKAFNKGLLLGAETETSYLLVTVIKN